VLNSLVARGSVGGRAALFALERLGFPVIFVPTVILPWHPGHGRATRITPPAAEFHALAEDIAEASWLAGVGAVLTGYFGSINQVAAAARLVAAVRKANPAARYLCDPAVGDSGGLFVPPALANAIGATLLPVADMATPNRFELDRFAGGAAHDLTAIRAATEGLAAPEVIVTSAETDLVTARVTTLVTSPEGAAAVTHALTPNAPKGTGDLFAALYLGHRLDGHTPPEATARAAAAVHRVVEAAVADGLDEMPLAATQGALAAAPKGVTITTLD